MTVNDFAFENLVNILSTFQNGLESRICRELTPNFCLPDADVVDVRPPFDPGAGLRPEGRRQERFQDPGVSVAADPPSSSQTHRILSLQIDSQVSYCVSLLLCKKS